MKKTLGELRSRESGAETGGKYGMKMSNVRTELEICLIDKLWFYNVFSQN